IPTPPSALTHTASNYSYPLSLPDALPILWTTHFPLPAMSVGTAPNGLYDRASHNGDVQHRNQIMTQLTKTGCQRRRERLWQTVGEDIEWLLIADPRHVQYLANFWVQPLSFSGGERGLLLLERDGRATLLGDNFTVRSAAHEPYVDREIVETWYDHKHSVINRDHALFAALKQVVRELAGRRGMVESEWLPLGAAA